METKHFLTHVNALRGLAILLVFLYHLRAEWCPQGFLGVDAFFVVSGFFLVHPLIRKAREGRFSWRGYYRSKLTRIIPALAVTVLISLAAASFLMLPDDLLAMADTGIATLTGRVNIHFGKQAVDYFASDVRENLFLHTWYIAVLLQVLLVAPLACVPLACLRSGWRASILGLLAIVSALIFFQHALPPSLQENLPTFLRDGGSLGSLYYMTAGRLWEILAGALIVWLPAFPVHSRFTARTFNTLCLASGLLLLVIPAFCPESSSGFALPAVAGTMMIIRYGEDTHLPRLLQNRIFLLLGTVSFSLYLIHWPVLALAHYTQIQEFSLWTCLGCTILSFLFTWGLYRRVERRTFTVRAALTLWVLALAGSLLLAHSGKNLQHLHPTAKEAPTYGSQEYQDWELASPTSWHGEFPGILRAHAGHCGDRVLHPDDELYGKSPVLRIGTDRNTPTFVLLGDSYANALFPGLDLIGREKGWSGLYVNFYLTPFWGRLNRENSNEAYFCTEAKLRALLDWLAHNPQLQHVLIMQCWKWRFESAESWEGTSVKGQDAWDFNAQALRTFCRKLKEIGRTPILMLPTPEADVIPNTPIAQWMRRRKLWYHDETKPLDISNSRVNYDKKMGSICELLRKLEQEGLCTLLNPLPVMFSGDSFHPIENGRLIVWDHDHMTVYGACRLVSGLQDKLDALFSPLLSPAPGTKQNSSGKGSERTKEAV